jgi:pyruvate, orthophosphate dikinase
MRWVSLLDGSPAPGREAIGGKAWSLARMRALGLPVPPAFVVTTEACHAYFDGGRSLPDGLEVEIAEGIAFLERECGRRLGDAERPLLVSVRSGAAVSMPGMMDTILDLGMNDATEAALAREAGDAAFTRDTPRRFCELFGRIVLEVSVAAGESAAAIRAAVAGEVGEAIPEDPIEQLHRAVSAVFESSRSRRARTYRKHHDLADDLGTAVTIQAMVFGNSGERSGTGVLFTRNPSTGAPEPWGEWLARAQGEDVVSGTTTPEPLDALRALLPDAHAALLAAARILERAERDAQDVEFTVDRGRLWFLQTRAAKRSPEAAVRIAVDLAGEGVISRDEALSRVTIEQVETLLRPRLSAEARAAATVLARGEPASQGIAQGLAVEDCDEAERRAEAGEDVVLARPTTSPEDVHGMIAARAVVTELGGATSHAAVVGRQLAKPCVVGCGEGLVARIVGSEITVDGGTGEVFAGLLPLEIPGEHDHPELAHLSEWAGGRPLAEALARRGADGAD